MYHMCTHCGHAFTNKIHLDQHVKTNHGESEWFYCKECRKRYKRRDQFQRHLLTHTEEESDHDTEMEESCNSGEETEQEDTDREQEDESCDESTEEEEEGSEHEEDTDMESVDEEDVIYTCKCGARIRVCAV